MTGPEPTIVDVVRVLRDTYTDYGVLVWLKAANKQLDGTSPEWLIWHGRIAQVLEAAERLESGG